MVEIIEELPKEKIKTCDLKVSKSGETMFIECKSIDNISQIEASKWKHFSSNILNLFIKNKVNWKMTIYPSDIVTHDDLETLRRTIKEAVKKKIPCEGHINDKIHFKLIEVLDWKEKNIQKLLNVGQGVMFHHIHVNTVALEDYNPSISNLDNQNNLQATGYFEAWVAPFEYIPTSKTIKYAFKTAKKQFPKESLQNIIYINVPSDNGMEFLKCRDESFDILYHRLNHDSTKVQAVILTGSLSQMASSIRPFALHHFIIPNYNAIQPLSPILDIVGAKLPSTADKYNSKMGTIIFEGKPDEGWRTKVSASVFEHISHDGKDQLIVWKTWRDTFRIEHISSANGREIAESDQIDFSEITKDSFLSFVLRWGERGIDLWLNSKIIAASYDD